MRPRRAERILVLIDGSGRHPKSRVMYLLRHIHRRHKFAVLDGGGLRRLGLAGEFRARLGRLGPPVGIFQWLDAGAHFAAYYSSPSGGRVRLDEEDFAVADVVAGDLEDIDDHRSRLHVTLSNGTRVEFSYSKPREPSTMDDWYPGRSGWDMPAKIADSLADPETRDEWARMEWAKRTRRLTS